MPTRVRLVLGFALSLAAADAHAAKPDADSVCGLRIGTSFSASPQSGDASYWGPAKITLSTHTVAAYRWNIFAPDSCTMLRKPAGGSPHLLVYIDQPNSGTLQALSFLPRDHNCKRVEASLSKAFGAPQARTESTLEWLHPPKQLVLLSHYAGGECWVTYAAVL